MNAKRIRLLVPFLLAIYTLTACAPLPPPGTPLTPEERASAQRRCIAGHTAFGVFGGALLGFVLSGGNVKGAVAGAAAGGLVSFASAWGSCLARYSDLRSYPVATARETIRRTGYNPSQGDVVKIEHYALNPQGVAPGGKVSMTAAYYVLSPDGEKEVKVVETRGLSLFDPKHNEWKELGDVDQEVTAAVGTRRAEGNFEIPADAPEGQYRITLKVTANGKSDQASRNLTVQKGMPTGPATVTENGEKVANSPATASKTAVGSKNGIRSQASKNKKKNTKKKKKIQHTMEN